ncbi:MAG: response regulator transcription factor [Gammaproteobacteria bacterium]
MAKTVWRYGLIMALGAFVLHWLEYRYAVRYFSTQIYIVAIALLFCALGIWVGHRLTQREEAAPFERNEQALATLQISPREVDVLELLAKGHSNQEIADGLFVSPNTVKTHLKNLYGKLDVARRTQAVRKARELRLIP